jgi:hypothetical protein
MHSFKRHCNILLACAEEAADARNRRHYLPRLVDQNLLDVVDLVFVGIVNVLLVPVGHSHRLARPSSLHPRVGHPEASNWGRASTAAKALGRCFKNGAAETLVGRSRNEDELASLPRCKAFNATCPLRTRRKRNAQNNCNCACGDARFVDGIRAAQHE